MNTSTKVAQILLETDDLNPEELVYGARQRYHPDVAGLMESPDTPEAFKEAILSGGGYREFFTPYRETWLDWFVNETDFDEGTWTVFNYRPSYMVIRGQVWVRLEGEYSAYRTNRVGSFIEGAFLVGGPDYNAFVRKNTVRQCYESHIAYLDFVLETGSDPFQLYDELPLPVERIQSDIAMLEELASDPENATRPVWLFGE